MKMPQVQLDYRGLESDTVHFRTAWATAQGTAFVGRGENETRYDVIEVHKLPGPVTPQLSQVGTEVGSYDVVGVVVFRFDDGVAVVEACGFDFWVDPEQVEEVLKLGSAARLSVRNLTLFVHR